MRALLALGIGVTGACASAPERSAPDRHADEHAPLPPGVIARDVDLGDWDLASVGDIGFAEIGVLAEQTPKLVVYHVGKTDPAPEISATKRGAPPLSEGGRLPITDARSGNRNHLGGYFNGFAKSPASARAALVDDVLSFSYQKQPGTFSGFWMHLFDSTARVEDRVYLDARGVAYLTFEVRGEVGGEPMRLQVADQRGERQQGSTPIDDIASFVPAGRITTEWQRAWVPLDVLDGRPIDRSELASLVFLVDPEGQTPRSGRIMVRDIAFTTERRVPAPVAPQPSAPNTAAASPRAPERKAMWLWETERLIADDAEIDKLLSFCRAEGFTDLFVQVPLMAVRQVDHPAPLAFDEIGYDRVVTRLAAGTRVHALDGAPYYARPAWHPHVAALVARLVAWNGQRPADARLQGVRFDIEPYLLPEWQGRGRARVLASYHALLSSLGPGLRAANLSLGVDIPFWWDERDERSGDLVAPLGGRSAAEVVIDLADDVGLMDYRTSAFGADGVLAHGAGELAYADTVGKTVFVGLETVVLPDERVSLWDSAPRTRWDVGPEIAIAPTEPGRARIFLIPADARQADGDYAWLGDGARFLRRREETFVPADKITFARAGREALAATIAESRALLARHPSFGGFVIHSYESYRRWFEGEPSGKRAATAEPTR